MRTLALGLRPRVASPIRATTVREWFPARTKYYAAAAMAFLFQSAALLAQTATMQGTVADYTSRRPVAGAFFDRGLF